MNIFIRIIGGLFVAGGIVHWLIIFGVLKETAPLVITAYFHSLAVLSPLAGTGLMGLRNWGRVVGMFIALTQIPAHAYMIYLDNFMGWESGLTFGERGLDIAFAVFYLVFFNLAKVRRRLA